MSVAFDLNLPSAAADAATNAARGEKLGYAGGWVPETTSNPFVCITAAAARTEHITLGTAISVAFARSPFVTAQSAWELARFSNGRFVLGLGTQVKGHIERRFGGEWHPPAPRIREYVEAVRALWRAFQSGERPSFQGEYYTHTLMSPAFDPGPIEYSDIQILVAAVKPGMARIAGEIADGVVAHPLASPTYLDDVLLPALHEGAAASGRSREDLTVLAPQWVVVADQDGTDEPLEALRRQIAFYGSTRTYSRVLSHHGWDGLAERLHTTLREEGATAARLITDDMIRTFAVVAPGSEVPEALADRMVGRADRCMVYSDIAQSWNRDFVSETTARLAG